MRGAMNGPQRRFRSPAHISREYAAIWRSAIARCQRIAGNDFLVVQSSIYKNLSNGHFLFADRPSRFKLLRVADRNIEPFRSKAQNNDLDLLEIQTP